jgi:hypothetical protein
VFSVEELRGLLGIPADKVINEALLEHLEAAAVDFVERYTGRYFGPPVVRTEVIQGAGTRTLWLANEPILREPVPADPADPEDPEGPDESPDTGDPGLSIELSYTLLPGDEPEPVLAHDREDSPLGWMLRDGRKMIRGGGALWTRAHEWTATYTAGYEPGQEPALIRAAVFALIRFRWGQAEKGGGLKSEAIGGYSYTLADARGAMLDDGFGSVKQALDLFRRPVI